MVFRKRDKVLRFICFIGLGAMLLLTCGCKNDSKQNATMQMEETERRVIVDSYGREVELPSKIERIVPLGNAPRMISYLGLAKEVVGIPDCEHAKSPIMAYAYVNKEYWKDLPCVGSDALGAGEWYAEEIIACAPDVIICTYDSKTADQIQNQTGIPVVAVTAENLFSEEYNDTLRIVGEACNASKRAEEVIAYIKECLKDLQTRTAKVKEELKPSVLGAGATFKGSHSIDGVYVKYPVFEVLDAEDVTVGIANKSGGLLVDREQILSWNPEMIFFDSNSMELIRTDYKENPDYFHQLQAVTDGELYQWPNSTWHYSNVEISMISAYYVGQLLYPEEFAEISFEEKAAEIFEFFLGEPDYLKELEAVGAGYGKVTLGGEDGE